MGARTGLITMLLSWVHLRLANLERIVHVDIKSVMSSSQPEQNNLLWPVQFVEAARQAVKQRRHQNWPTPYQDGDAERLEELFDVGQRALWHWSPKGERNGNRKCLWGQNSSLVVYWAGCPAWCSVMGSIFLWGEFVSVKGIFPLELIWVLTPSPPKLFQMRVYTQVQSVHTCIPSHGLKRLTLMS